jgi:hypothetical protein
VGGHAATHPVQDTKTQQQQPRDLNTALHTGRFVWGTHAVHSRTATRLTFWDCMAMILNISNTLLSNGATTNSPVSGSGRSLPPLGATQNTLPPAAASSPSACCVRRHSAHNDGKT